MSNSSSRVSSLVTFSDIQRAVPFVSARIGDTPLTHSKQLSDLLGISLSIKWENRFHTGSFKERGVVNFLAQLSEQKTAGLTTLRGVCTASAGNHALALSYHAQQYKIPCVIVMPEHAPLVKIERNQSTGAEVILAGDSFEYAYVLAKEIAAEKGYMFVPGFDHPWIVAGAGTAGISIAQSIKDLTTVVVPIGGGGLAAGVALAIKTLRPDVRVIGVQSEWKTRSMQNTVSARVGEISQENVLFKFPSLADGIAVKQPSATTAPLLSAYIDEIVSVSEDEIADGILAYVNYEHAVIEGAGAAALAALLAKKGVLVEKLDKQITPEVCVFACGSNIDPSLLSRLIERDLAHRERICRFAVSVPDRPGSLHRITGIISGARANIIEVQHDRSFGEPPGAVEISFTVEIQNAAHKNALLDRLRSVGLAPKVR